MECVDVDRMRQMIVKVRRKGLCRHVSGSEAVSNLQRLHSPIEAMQ